MKIWGITVVLASVALATVPMQGQVKPPRIVPAQERSALVEATEAILNVNRPVFLAQVEGTWSPFLAPPEEEEVIETRPVSEKPIVVEESPRLPDEVVLQAFARSFKPAGVLQRGPKFLLSLPNGALVVEGSGKTLSIRGDAYRVEIAKISRDRYMLRLGEATLVRPIEEQGGDGRVTRDR